MKCFQVIKTRLARRWPGINFFEDVLIVLPIPAKYSEKAKFIMRQSIYNAELIGDSDSSRLQFITERESIIYLKF
jgi:hypothetical protein